MDRFAKQVREAIKEFPDTDGDTDRYVVFQTEEKFEGRFPMVVLKVYDTETHPSAKETRVNYLITIRELP